MTRAARRLRLEILSPWLCGDGAGTGLLYDQTTVRDRDALPFVPGKHLKGLLRDAVEQLVSWGQVKTAGDPEDVVPLLFGAEAERGERDLMPVGAYFGGLLTFTNAELPPASRQPLLALPPIERRRTLYLPHHATKMDESGVAADKSLRVIEAAVPLMLEADIAVDPGRAALLGRERGPVLKEWPDIVIRALPLVRALGAHRTRGFGRVTMTLQEVAS